MRQASMGSECAVPPNAPQPGRGQAPASPNWAPRVRTKRTHARPSKDYHCDGCGDRIRWMPNVYFDGRRIWCPRCWIEVKAQPLGEVLPTAPGPRGPTPYRPPSSIYPVDGEDECPPLEEETCYPPLDREEP